MTPPRTKAGPGPEGEERGTVLHMSNNSMDILYSLLYQHLSTENTHMHTFILCLPPSSSFSAGSCCWSQAERT